MALGLFAEVIRVARPALRVEKTQRCSLRSDGQRAVQVQSLRAVDRRADGADACAGRMHRVVQTRGVLNGQDDQRLPGARELRLPAVNRDQPDLAQFVQRCFEAQPGLRRRWLSGLEKRHLLRRR